MVRNAFLSVDPAMRGWIADTRGYLEPVPLGAVMRSLACGHVIASRHPNYAEGDPVIGWFGWQALATVDASTVVRKIRETDLQLSLSLSVLGLTGATALIALTKLGEPKPGETVVVSTAAGSVGSAVGQIAKLMGCRAVGIAGGPDKVRACVEAFGYEAAFDYRADDLDAGLERACPDGVDVYFDNTAGAISDAVHRKLAPGARIIVCGTASVADWSDWPSGPRVERHLLVKRARMQGFVLFDHMAVVARALSYNVAHLKTCPLSARSQGRLSRVRAGGIGLPDLCEGCSWTLARSRLLLLCHPGMHIGEAALRNRIGLVTALAAGLAAPAVSAQAPPVGPASAPPPQGAQIDLAKTFHTRSAWRFVVTEGPPAKDYGGDDAPGALTLCLRKGPAAPCLSDPVTPPLQATPPGYPAWEPHYLLAAKVVFPRGRKAAPFLLIVTGSLYSGDGGQKVATQLVAYDVRKDAFRRVYAASTGHNNNQEIRFITKGPLRGSVITAEPQEHSPYGYRVVVNRLTPAGVYRVGLRYRSATLYNDGNPLAVIDSEMPNIEMRLGLWSPGQPVPTPSLSGDGKPCLEPTLRHAELWCG